MNGEKADWSEDSEQLMADPSSGQLEYVFLQTLGVGPPIEGAPSFLDEVSSSGKDGRWKGCWFLQYSFKAADRRPRFVNCMLSRLLYGSLAPFLPD